MEQIDKNKIIEVDPLIFVYGLQVKNVKQAKRILLFTDIIIICGSIAMIGLLCVLGLILNI